MAIDNSLRLITGEDAPGLAVSKDDPPAEAGGVISHLIFLCAEDDDLKLVQLVHRAREEQISVEVLPGIDRDVDDVLARLDGVERDGCVLFCSKDYPPSAALGFRQRFEARFPEDELIVVELDPARMDSTLGFLIRRLVLSRPTSQSGVQVAPELPVESDPASRVLDSQGAPEEEQPRPKLVRVLGGLVVLAGLIGFIGWKATANQEPSDPTAQRTAPAEPPEASVGTAVGDAKEPRSPSKSEHEEPVSEDLALLQRLLGEESTALKGLPDEQIAAAALLVSAVDRDSPCTPFLAGEAALETANPALLTLLLDNDKIDKPSGCSAEPPEESSEAPENGRRRRKAAGKRRQRSRDKEPLPTQPPGVPPEPQVPEPEAKPEPKPEPKPETPAKPRARLIDDGLRRTTE